METGYLITAIGAMGGAIGTMGVALKVLWQSTQEDKKYARERAEKLVDLTERSITAIENNTKVSESLPDRLSHIVSSKRSSGKRT